MVSSISDVSSLLLSSLRHSLSSLEVVLDVFHDVRGGGKVGESPLPLGPHLGCDAVHYHTLRPSSPAPFLHLLQPLLNPLSSDGLVALLFL